MILKMTLCDNDYTFVIEQFSKKLLDRIYWWYDKPEDMDFDSWYLNTVLPKKQVQKVLNSNNNSISKEDLALIYRLVREEWIKFINDMSLNNNKTSEYLKDNFQVSQALSFNDEWENGEAVYYFVTDQQYCTR